MRHAARAEWTKLLRRSMVLGAGGALLGAILLVLLLTLRAVTGGSTPGGPAPGMRPTIGTLEASDGILLVYGILVHVVGLVAAVVFAQSMGGEYAHGTLRVALTREPRRLVFLGGKVVALAAFLGVGLVVTIVPALGIAGHVGQALGVDLGAWLTGPGLAATASGLGRLWITGVVQGFLGLTLGLVLRAPAPAVGASAGYLLAIEPLVLQAWSGGAEWLPGPVLAAFARGGTPILPFGEAALLVVVYTAALLVVSGAVFARRDVVE